MNNIFEDKEYMDTKLRDSNWILIIGLISVVASLGLLTVLILGLSIVDKGELYSVLGMFIFFFTLGLYLVIHYIIYQIRLNDNSIIIKNILGNETEFDWNAIVRVEQNKAKNALILISESNKVRIENILKDYNVLVDFLLEKVDKTKFSDDLIEIINKMNK